MCQYRFNYHRITKPKGTLQNIYQIKKKFGCLTNNETFKVINTSLTDLKNNESLLYSRTVVPNGVELSPGGNPEMCEKKKKCFRWS